MLDYEIRGTITNPNKFTETLKAYIMRGQTLIIKYGNKVKEFSILDYYKYNDFTELYQIVKKAHKKGMVVTVYTV